MYGPAYDLPTVMTKMLHVGMPLSSVIEAVTSNPARIINREREIGSLSCGVCADVTLLRLVDWNEMLEDTQGQMRRLRQRFIPVAVWKSGERIQVTDKICPNMDPKYQVSVKKEQSYLVIRDTVRSIH